MCGQNKVLNFYTSPLCGTFREETISLVEAKQGTTLDFKNADTVKTQM